MQFPIKCQHTVKQPDLNSPTPVTPLGYLHSKSSESVKSRDM